MKVPTLLFSLSATVLAQVYTPPTEDPKPQPTSPGSDTVVRSPQENAGGGSPFGQELPFFDSSTETISWNGTTWAASDNRLFAARFEKYLNEPEDQSAEAQEYRKTISEILDTLSPQREGGPNLYEAFKLLPRASSYPGDAKLCDSLANSLYTALLARKDVRGTKAMLAAMDEEKARLISKGDWKARNDRDNSLSKARPTGSQTADPTPIPGVPTDTTDNSATNDQEVSHAPGRGTNSLEYQEYIRRLQEIEIQKKAHELQSGVKTELAKMQYQALMVQFFLQRRFQHVIIASRFYNQIWKDGDGTLYLDEKSDVNQLFTESLGVSPTVSTLDSLANEAMRDVDKGVEAFLFLVERDELQSASKRLSESYMIGEFMPSIGTLPREKKRKVQEFVRGYYTLVNAIDAKDYSKARQLVEELNSKAADFDSTKAEAAIATYTRASDMSIMMAKNHLAAQDTEKAREEIKKAMEVWPQNPKLAEFDQLVEAGGSMVKARNDFDRLFAEENYREVVKRQYEFAPAIQGDEEREGKFRQVLGNIQQIEAAVAGSKKYSSGGMLYAAWEELEGVHERFPDDPVLNQELTALAPQVADFTMALKRADDFEKNGQIGSALSWYYKAKSLHPTSDLAESGIARLINHIIPEPGTIAAE
ncbi:MAG: tetratricopeptide repeat protein [Verrucomicrobiales bacterium]